MGGPAHTGRGVDQGLSGDKCKPPLNFKYAPGGLWFPTAFLSPLALEKPLTIFPISPWLELREWGGAGAVSYPWLICRCILQILVMMPREQLHWLGSVLSWAYQDHLDRCTRCKRWHTDTQWWGGSCALKWHILPGRASRGAVPAEGLTKKTWSQLWSRGGHLGSSYLAHLLGSCAAVMPNTTENWVATPPAHFGRVWWSGRGFPTLGYTEEQTPFFWPACCGRWDLIDEWRWHAAIKLHCATVHDATELYITWCNT